MHISSKYTHTKYIRVRRVNFEYTIFRLSWKGASYNLTICFSSVPNRDRHDLEDTSDVTDINYIFFLPYLT